MKVKLTEKPKIEFEPVEITITIESLAELANLAARLDLGVGTVYEHYDEKVYSEGNVRGLDVNGFKLWEELDRIYNQ